MFINIFVLSCLSLSVFYLRSLFFFHRYGQKFAEDMAYNKTFKYTHMPIELMVNIYFKTSIYKRSTPERPTYTTILQKSQNIMVNMGLHLYVRENKPFFYLLIQM